MEYPNSSFEYTYSAPQQEEIRRIREKYLPPEEDKLTRLRRLDAKVTQRGTVTSLVVGIGGALILGLGMSCVMVWGKFLIGILLGIPGLVLVAAAYPIYDKVTKTERAKIADEVIRLTDELMK